MVAFPAIISKTLSFHVGAESISAQVTKPWLQAVMVRTEQFRKDFLKNNYLFRLNIVGVFYEDLAMMISPNIKITCRKCGWSGKRTMMFDPLLRQILKTDSNLPEYCPNCHSSQLEFHIDGPFSWLLDKLKNRN